MAYSELDFVLPLYERIVPLLIVIPTRVIHDDK